MRYNGTGNYTIGVQCMTSNTWRNIFVGIILLSIPCYLLGIGIWFFSGGGVEAPATATRRPSGTPIDTDALETEFALTNPADAPTQLPFASATSSGLGLTPIIPTTFSNPTSTSFFVATATPFQQATITPFPTNTPLPSNTSIPTNAPPVLPPPSDTPSP